MGNVDVRRKTYSFAGHKASPWGVCRGSEGQTRGEGKEDQEEGRVSKMSAVTSFRFPLSWEGTRRDPAQMSRCAQGPGFRFLLASLKY